MVTSRREESEESLINGVGSGDSIPFVCNHNIGVRYDKTTGSLPKRVGGYVHPVRVPVPVPQRSGDRVTERALGSYRISHSGDVKKDFLAYLERTGKFQFRLIGTSIDGVVVMILPFVHRWTEPYQKSILAKFYQLDEWMRNNPGIITMVTLTVYQGSKSRFNDGSFSRKIKGHDLTFEESHGLLITSRKKLLNVLRNRYPGINYFWVIEPHPETGFAHCHLVLFKELSEVEQNDIIALWSNKYQAGSKTHGVKITSRPSDESIASITNYLMKDMDKQFGTGDPWTEQELLFNAMMWKTGSRMWGASKDLTVVMRRPVKESGIVWDKVELLTPAGEFEIWTHDDGEPFLDFSNVEKLSDEDDLSEGPVTLRLWERTYRARRNAMGES